MKCIHKDVQNCTLYANPTYSPWVDSVHRVRFVNAETRFAFRSGLWKYIAQYFDTLLPVRGDERTVDDIKIVNKRLTLLNDQCKREGRPFHYEIDSVGSWFPICFSCATRSAMFARDWVSSNRCLWHRYLRKNTTRTTVNIVGHQQRLLAGGSTCTVLLVCV